MVAIKGRWLSLDYPVSLPPSDKLINIDGKQLYHFASLLNMVQLLKKKLLHLEQILSLRINSNNIVYSQGKNLFYFFQRSKLELKNVVSTTFEKGRKVLYLLSPRLRFVSVLNKMYINLTQQIRIRSLFSGNMTGTRPPLLSRWHSTRFKP